MSFEATNCPCGGRKDEMSNTDKGPVAEPAGSRRERPILFSGPMVRAILAGRKMQTRRAIKPQPSRHHWENLPGYEFRVEGPYQMNDGRMGVRFSHRIQQNRNDDGIVWSMCPFGSPGDRLWVRETWMQDHLSEHRRALYKASCGNTPQGQRWRPSIYMPRWASRIALQIVDVRVERLCSISRGDAMAEGCPHQNMMAGTSPVVWFSELWERINGEGSWSANPWVWVVEFKSTNAEVNDGARP